jgi:two-component system, OmpR family, alkaline phosphatase synthesis response regulator PhoP
MPENTKRVLVVDDEDDVRTLMRRLLEKVGYTVQTAAGGVEAIRSVDASRPDLVLLDLVMPGLDGWAVMERLQASDPPPIVLLASPGSNAKDGPFRDCVAAYLAKPLHSDELVATCARILSARAVPDAIRDRRQESRRRLIVKVVLLSQDGNPVLAGRLVDLSKHGLQMEVGIALETGAPVRILLHMPGPNSQLELEGFVRWRNPLDEGGFAYGVDLSKITATAARLLHAALSPHDANR